MREILFRGKDPETGVWHEGQYIHLHKTTYCFSGGEERDAENEIHQIVFEQMTDWNLPNRHLRADVLPETVGQFTGLTDKNGKRIFEGDILKVQTRVYIEEDNPVFGKMKALTEEKRTRYWVVEWGNQTCVGASWYFYGKDRRFNRRASKSALWNSEAEVVGNIHDNPELMEGDA